MAIAPTSGLIQALAYPARPAGAVEDSVPLNRTDAARAAARAAFQAAQQNTAAPTDPTIPKPVEPPAPAENGRIRPRGSVINIVI